MRIPFILDPVTQKQSVSLTLLVISFVSLLVAAGLEIAGKTTTTSLAMETFLTTTGLYFSRRFSFKGKNVEVNPVKEEESK